MSIAQPELEGVAPPKTLAQGEAENLTEVRESLDVIREKVKKQEEDLIVAMRRDKVTEVKVRDVGGFLHTYSLEDLQRIRHRRIA